jgi:FKBP12-rapamycin complex-associated protein
MAVLEAFVYDPLINWRLLTPLSPGGSNKGKNATKADNNGNPSSPSSSLPFLLFFLSSSPPDPSLPTSLFTLFLLTFFLSSEFQNTALSRSQKDERQLVSEWESAMPEILNERAVTVINRVSKKLTGRDFSTEKLNVQAQVQRLIDQATSHENLCQCYIGWCPFW